MALSLYTANAVAAVVKNAPIANCTAGGSEGITSLKMTGTILKLKYLAFRGGGMRGGAFCSALDVLDEILFKVYSECLSDRIQGCAGTSIGSLVAFMMVTGFQPKQMVHQYRQTTLKSNEECVR